MARAMLIRWRCPAGKLAATVADIGIVTFLGVHNEIVGIGYLAASTTCSMVAFSTPKAMLLKKVSLKRMAS